MPCYRVDARQRRKWIGWRFGLLRLTWVIPITLGTLISITAMSTTTTGTTLSLFGWFVPVNDKSVGVGCDDARFVRLHYWHRSVCRGWVSVRTVFCIVDTLVYSTSKLSALLVVTIFLLRCNTKSPRSNAVFLASS